MIELTKVQMLPLSLPPKSRVKILESEGSRARAQPGDGTERLHTLPVSTVTTTLPMD